MTLPLLQGKFDPPINHMYKYLGDVPLHVVGQNIGTGMSFHYHLTLIKNTLQKFLISFSNLTGSHKITLSAMNSDLCLVNMCFKGRNDR